MSANSQDHDTTLREWIVRPSTWSLRQRLAMLSYGCVAGAVLTGAYVASIGNLFAYGAVVLLFMLIITKAVSQFFIQDGPHDGR